MGKIKFGIRFKITGVIIVSALFASALIGLALYNSQVRHNEEEMLRLGGTVLKGGVEHARSWFRHGDLIKEEFNKEKPDVENIKAYSERRKKSFRLITEFFPEMIKREALLDISFLVAKKHKRGKLQEEYIYFKRKKPGIFSRSFNDPELRRSIVGFFYSHISLEPHLSFTGGRNNQEKSFILVGVPILASLKSEEVYRDFLKSKQEDIFSHGKIQQRKQEKLRFKSYFSEKIVNLSHKYDYNINLSNRQRLQRAFYRFISNYDFRGKKLKFKDLRIDFLKEVKTNGSAGWISFVNMKRILRGMVLRNKLVLKGNKKRDIWYGLFRYLKKEKVAIGFNESLDELALKAYNLELKGILGITLHRKTFYADAQKNKTDIFNLALSILIRCLFIAFFFPGFIISSLKKLSQGAEKFGAGKLDYRININSGDELASLAGHLNSMAQNLERAREVELEKHRMENELETASQIQETLLPLKIPQFDGVTLAAHYSSATESGGDYYDFYKLKDSRLALTVADVSGHGVASGLVMAMTRTLFHTFLEQTDDLKSVVGGINSYLYKNTGAQYFVSMFMGIFDVEKGVLKYVSCGHNPGYILRKGVVRELPAGGIALGAVGSGTLESMLKVRSVALNRGDILVQYTDGIPEMMNAKEEEFGDEQFKALLADFQGGDIQVLVDRVVKSVEAFKGDAIQHDDFTLTVMKFEG